MASGKTTRDHDEIRSWAEERGGKPGVVAATETENQTGILRIFFPNAPNHNDDALEEIGWDEFFEKFDESGLQLIYQDKTADGKLSDFNKLTYPDPDSPEGKALLRKTTAKKHAKSASKKTATKSAASAATTSAKSAPKPVAKSAAKKSTASESTPKPSAAKKVAAAPTQAKKSTAKKASTKTAALKSKSDRPARNYPKPEHGSGHNQVF